MAEMKKNIPLFTFAPYGKNVYNKDGTVYFTDAIGRVIMLFSKVDYTRSFQLDEAIIRQFQRFSPSPGASRLLEYSRLIGSHQIGAKAEYIQDLFPEAIRTEPKAQLPSQNIGGQESKGFVTAEDRLEEANATVAQLSTALAEAKQVQQAMLHLAQLQTVQRAHKELYGPDPETGLTAAQEYSAFKQAQREQQSK
jgi:hypothetical protein